MTDFNLQSASSRCHDVRAALSGQTTKIIRVAKIILLLCPVFVLVNAPVVVSVAGAIITLFIAQIYLSSLSLLRLTLCNLSFCLFPVRILFWFLFLFFFKDEYNCSDVMTSLQEVYVCT